MNEMGPVEWLVDLSPLDIFIFATVLSLTQQIRRSLRPAFVADLKKSHPPALGASGVTV